MFDDLVRKTLQTTYIFGEIRLITRFKEKQKEKEKSNHR